MTAPEARAATSPKDPLEGLPKEGALFDGKYRIGPVLGIGGMAAVIAAKHLGFDQMVALKVLLPECCDDPAVVERFVQEGRTAIKIRSEHVVRMLDVGVVAGRAYLAMEHLDGRDLEVLLREKGPLPFETAVDLILQACEAIGEAHALGIIHRDLKPANLFLTHRVDGGTCVKVLDFGISKMPRGVSGASLSGSHPTLPSIVMGSPQYMSPEQMVSAAAADQRSDIWSLGVTLYQLVTGQIAFDGSSTAEVCARVLQGTPAPLAQLRPDVPADFDLIVSRCLEKDRSRRYANVADFARALAPLGSPAARASADSIARVFEGGIEVQSPSRSEVPTIKPTAAAILAGVPALRRRGAGYVIALVVALGAIGVVGRGIAGRIASLRAVPVVAVAPSPPPDPPAPLLATTATATAAEPPPGPYPVKHRHTSVRKSAPPTSSDVIAPMTSDDGGPYERQEP